MSFAKQSCVSLFVDVRVHAGETEDDFDQGFGLGVLYYLIGKVCLRENKL